MSEVVGENAGESVVVAKEVKIEHIISIIGDMNRFLALIASAKAFTEAEIGLADWLVLGTVSGQTGATPKHLVKSLGITPQRVNQIVERLKGKQFLSQGGQTADTLILTGSGSTLVLQLNERILDLLRPGLNGRERFLFSVWRSLKPLMQVFSPVKKTAV
jgi:DNA-binding MarR family transcriptional regulator